MWGSNLDKRYIKASHEMIWEYFWTYKFPRLQLSVFSLTAAFLTFLALKLKNKETCELVTPNSPIDIKK